jgi:tetratricopeptide (TPR) repeat protein
VSSEPDFGLRSEFYTFAPETLAQELPDFEIVREVGKGSMGIVYEARRRDDGRRIALKVLPPSLTLTERALARFLREARIMAKVSHPAIVAVLEHDRRGRLHYFAMEFVDGVTLQQRLEVGPMPVRQACEIGAEVGRALQFAHEHGIVHRDLKPGNVMLRENPGGGPRIAITDFGLARETGTGSMTESGAIVGTPMYMAPEMVIGGTVQATTLADVYGLGATLYTLVTGQPPYDGPTAQNVLKQVIEKDPPRPRRLRADLPAGVEAIILKAMEREPRRRYGSAQELAEDLERFLRGERVLARRPGAGARAWRVLARHPLLTGLVATVLLLLVLGAGLLRERRQRELQASLADAERLLALAATTRDEQDRPRSADGRRDLLLGAVASASEVIRRDDSFALAWFIRAKAHHRLRQYSEAIFDLDMAERLLGESTPEILHFRIDALRQRGDRGSVERLQQDLTRLLLLDPGDHTRALVAEHLLELAAQARGRERDEALGLARDALAKVEEDEPHAGIAQARLLELSGDRDGALAALRAVRRRHQGNVYVHLQAAAMFGRLGRAEEGRAEQEMALLLAPAPGEAPLAVPLDLEGVGGFLGEVNRLLEALDRKEPEVKGNPGR